jgi:hypothetical protein
LLQLLLHLSTRGVQEAEGEGLGYATVYYDNSTETGEPSFHTDEYRSTDSADKKAGDE